MSYYFNSNSPSELGGLLPKHCVFKDLRNTADSTLDKLISMDDLREHLRLMGDTGEDIFIERLRYNAAIQIESIVDRPCTPRQMTCYYSGWGERFALTEHWKSIENIVVDYEGVDGDTLEFNISTDPTGDYFIVLVDEREVNLSPNFDNPVNITFTYTPSQDFQSAAQQAAQFLVNQIYQPAGQVVANNTDMYSYAYDILRPYRRLVT